MQSRKFTSWKKSKKFGDVQGGRQVPKLADRIFNRQHNLEAPNSDEKRPIYINENPSKDFYFPISINDIKNIFNKLPSDQTNHITHIWLKRIKKSDYLKGKTYQGYFISGSKVYLIVINPFPIDNKMRFTKNKPIKKILDSYKDYTNDLRQDHIGWYLQWNDVSIKKYYSEKILLYLIGMSLDSFNKRYWSKANKNKVDNFAKNYTIEWTSKIL